MEDKINKLPKWAQELIADLKRQREVAITAINRFCDNETPSKFLVEDFICTGESKGPITKKHYIQAHKIEVHHADIELTVTAYKTGVIGLQWDRKSSGMWDRVALVPRSYMACDLIPVEAIKKEEAI